MKRKVWIYCTKEGLWVFYPGTKKQFEVMP